MSSSDDERQLLSLISHELRSPAAVVAGYLRLLLKKDAGEMPDDVRRLIEEANQSTARLLRVTQELGDLAELTGSSVCAGPLSTVPVFAVCDEVVRTAAETAKGPAAFSCDSGDQAVLVSGDPRRLKRALTALVEAMLRERGEKPLEIHGFVEGENGARLAIIALGEPGLAARRAEVLDPALPFDRWRGGTGLSVPIACRILEGYGGRVWSLPFDSRANCALGLPVVS